MSTRTFTFTVTAPSQGTLKPLADTMTSGSFAQVTGSNINSVVATFGSWNYTPLDCYTPTGPEPTLQWGSKAYWDSTNRRMWFCGGPPGSGTAASPRTAFVLYDDLTNTWSRLGPVSETTGLFSPWSAGHGYDASCVDVARRRFYRAVAAEAPSGGWGWTRLYGVDLDTSVVVGQIEPSGTTPASFPPALEYFPGMVGGDSVVVVSVAGNYNKRWNIQTNAWSTIPALPSLSGATTVYHNGKVYIGGGTGNTAFYSLNADGTVTTLASSPRPFSTQLETWTDGRSMHGFLAGLNGYIYAVSGTGEIFRYNIAGNSWTTTGSNLSSIRLPATHMAGVGVSIPDANAILLVFDNPNSAYLWKP